MNNTPKIVKVDNTFLADAYGISSTTFGAMLKPFLKEIQDLKGYYPHPITGKIIKKRAWSPEAIKFFIDHVQKYVPIGYEWNGQTLVYKKDKFED